MNTLYEKLLDLSPWITIVLPSAAVIGICFVNLALLKLIIPATLACLFVLIAYSLFR